MKTKIIVIALILVCIIFVFAVFSENNKHDSDNDIGNNSNNNLDESKNNDLDKSKTDQTNETANDASGTYVVSDFSSPDQTIKAFPSISVDTISNNDDEKTIKQYRINLSDISYRSRPINEISLEQCLELSHEYDFKYPIRIRSARDIIHPDSSGTIEPDYQINNPSQLAKSINQIFKIGLSNNMQKEFNYKLWEKVVIQEIPLKGSEYIISCLNGVIDKFYVVNNGAIKEISLKNLSDVNKKYLRKIIFEQHKKLGTVTGLFELGFFASDLKTILSDDPDFRFIGLSIVLELTRSRAKSIKNPLKMISYPYRDKNADNVTKKNE